MSVVNWEQPNTKFAQLTEKQFESIFLLSSIDARYIPLVEADDTCLDKPHNEKTASDDGLKSETVHMSLISHFYSWLSGVEQHIDKTESMSEIHFLECLKKKRQYCTSVMDQLNDILGSLTTLREYHALVSQKTSSLHDDCEHLLQMQRQMIEETKQIEAWLGKFVNVDIVEDELKRTNLVVSDDKMKHFLDQLDDSIAFLNQHMNYKEAGNYLVRANEVLKKVLNIINNYVMRIIDRTINELADVQDVVDPDYSFILLYGRFRSQGPKIRPLMSIVEERVNLNIEYSKALAECHTFYLQRRQHLLVPVSRSTVANLVNKYRDDHCALLRTGGALIANLCEDEIRLFSQFFAMQFPSSLNEMLTKLCNALYDAFRPMIIHINHVEILSELCDIIKCELVEVHVINKELDMTAFDELCSLLLADIQERLVYRSTVYIRSQILGYQPSPGDIAYPEKLVMMDAVAKSVDAKKSKRRQQPDLTSDAEDQQAEGVGGELQQQEEEDEADIQVQPGPNMSLAPADLHGMWYPTVRRALDCLSKLSRCLNVDMFRVLAQECVSMCIQSLVEAGDAITARRTAADGQLFLIKYLLILQEQMAPFTVDLSVKEASLDFSNYKEAAKGLWQQPRNRLFSFNRNNVLLRFLLDTPNIIEVVVDSRRQLNGQLKHTCEVFIGQTVAQLTGEIPHLLERANLTLSSPGARLSDQVTTNASAVKEVVARAHRLLRSTLVRPPTSSCQESDGKGTPTMSLLARLHLYLANPDTEAILLRRIQTGVLALWRQLYHLVASQYNEEDRMIIACLNESQIRLLFQNSV